MLIGGNNKQVATISDISKLMNCKVLMPFTEDLLDHSLIKKETGVLTGTLNLNDKGAVFTRTQNMFIDCDLNVTDDYTIEILIAITNDTHEAYFLGGQGANTFYLCYTNNTKSFYFGRHGSNALKVLTTIVELNKVYHIALVMDKGTYKAYINGKQVTLIDINSVKPTANTTRIYLGRPYTDLNSSIYSLDGIVGGLKITSKALDPSEFSLSRPFTLPEVNFQKGAKTFLFKDGILDHRIILPSGIKNNGDYLVNSGGNAVLNFNIPEIIGKKLFLKTFATGSAASNKYFLIWQIGTTNAYLKEYFDSEAAMNRIGYLGYDYSGLDASYSQRISFTGNANQMRIYEIWYE